MELLYILLSIPIILGVGYIARAIGILTAGPRDRLNAVAYYVALPALLFTSTAGRALSEIISTDLIAGVVLVMGATIAVAWIVHRNRSDQSVRSVVTIQSYHSNFGYLGVPLVALIFGEVATGRAALILGIGALIQVTATISLLSTLNGAGTIRADIRRIFLNPIMLALLGGLLFSAFDISLHASAIAMLSFLGQFALPIALLCAGASLTIHADAISYWLTGSVIAIKIVLMPIIAFVIFLTLGSESETIRAAVLMFAMPSAVSTYVFASELGGHSGVASRNVFLTTIISTGSLYLVTSLLFVLT